MELEPQELLPTIPPIMALFAVDVSGPKNKPCGFKNIFNSSLITPGCTRTHFSATFSSRILVKFLDTSTTMPLPTTWPAREVPAVRGINDDLFVCANAISVLISCVVFGILTAIGISRYAEASVAYKMRMVSSVKKSPSIELANSCSFSFIYQ